MPSLTEMSRRQIEREFDWRRLHERIAKYHEKIGNFLVDYTVRGCKMGINGYAIRCSLCRRVWEPDDPEHYFRMFPIVVISNDRGTLDESSCCYQCCLEQDTCEARQDAGDWQRAVET